MNAIIPIDVIQQKIYLMRGQKVMLDRDLAELYYVETRALNQAVRRNINRFPDDFMFQLSQEEIENWKSQIVISNKERMGLRKRPYAFTEHGVIMLANVLNSPRAAQASIQVVRAFIKLREIFSRHKELASKLNQLERKIEKNDKEINVIFQTIRALMAPPEKKQRNIGFKREKE